MIMRRAYETIIAGGGGFAGVLARPVLSALSGLYRLGLGVRNASIQARGGDGTVVGAPVISIGNLTTGGTGKTPMVIHVVERLRALGGNPVVVSRGYGAGDGPADELLLVERAVPGVVGIAEPNRVAGARRAIAEHAADVIVLDDGFQHRRIHRDLELVLVDATEPLAEARLIPRGRLREPLSALSRADAVVLTRCDQVSESARTAQVEWLAARAPGLAILTCAHATRGLTTLEGTGWDAGAATLPPVLLVSGIAKPRAFERSVASAGFNAIGHRVLADHHRYTPDDAALMEAEARACGAAGIVVTEKDAVKLARLEHAWALPVIVLPVRIDFAGDGATMLDELLMRAVAKSAEQPAA
jgi:tetraacyldisaccharide 4'-kinase